MPSGNQGSTPCRSCSAESRSPLRHLRMTAECAWASFESALLPVQQTGKPVHTCHIRFKGCPSVLNTTLLKSIAGFGEKRRYRYFSVSAGKKLSILSNGVFPSTSTSSYSPVPVRRLAVLLNRHKHVVAPLPTPHPDIALPQVNRVLCDGVQYVEGLNRLWAQLVLPIAPSGRHALIIGERHILRRQTRGHGLVHLVAGVPIA